MSSVNAAPSLLVAPSALAADFSRLGQELKSTEDAGADWHHVDVMDGHFVPNLSFGFPVIKAMKRAAKIPLDVHLMISNPAEYFSRYVEAGADRVTYHWEALEDHSSAIKALKNLNVKVGISIKPGTCVEVLTDYLPQIDQVLVMSVEPGFGGQSYMPSAEPKIAWLRSMAQKLDTGLRIVVDGGITDKTAPKAVASGADVLVAGSFVYKSTDRVAAIQSLR